MECWEEASIWGTRLVVAAFIGGMILGAGAGSSQLWNPFRPNTRIWKGHVDIVLEGSQEVRDEKISEQSRNTSQLAESVSDLLSTSKPAVSHGRSL